MSQALFRQQVLDRQSERLRGELILSQPLSHTVFTLFLAALVALALIFLVRHEYVRKQTVPGALVPDQGLIEVRAPATGSLAHMHVEMDSIVAVGAPLFTLQLDHTLASDAALTAQLRAEVRAQEVALRQQMQELELLVVNERLLLEVNAGALARAANLRDRRLLAPADYDAVYAQLLQQQSAVGRLLVEQARMRAEAAELQKQQVRLTAEQATTVLAPVRGRVTSMLRQHGMGVTAQEPVLVLLPEGAMLQAELWLPSSASGFVNPGQTVNLRYEAFPYQKFGVQQAHVSEIAESGLAPQAGMPPLFRALATLKHQDLMAYGSARPLRPGMALSADIVVDKRSLLEWLLEPLFSIKGKLQGGE